MRERVHYVAGCNQSQEKKVVGHRYHKPPGRRARIRLNIVAPVGPKSHCVDDPDEVTCLNCLAKMKKRTETQVVSFTTVRRGWILIDKYHQECRVEVVSRKYKFVETRRREGRTYWDSVAKWTPEQFDARRWRRVQ